MKKTNRFYNAFKRCAWFGFSESENLLEKGNQDEATGER